MCIRDRNEALEAGSLINEDVFPTGNFGSHAKENMEILEKFMQRHNIEAPLMCMELDVYKRQLLFISNTCSTKIIIRTGGSRNAG